MVWLALPADMIRSRHGIMILCHDEMAALWLPRICCMARFAFLADLIRSRHGITIFRHDEMDALWLPRISLAWLALPALLTRSAVGMESRFFAMMKWLSSGYPGSVVWLALPALLTRSVVGMESRFSTTMKWLPSGSPGSVLHGSLCLPC